MASAPTTDLRMNKGDDYSTTLTIYKNSVIEDITGYEITFTLKNQYLDPDSIAVYQQVKDTFDEPTEGKVILSIPRAISRTFTRNSYIYDVQMKDADGLVRTIMRGPFYVDWDVTDTA